MDLPASVCSFMTSSRWRYRSISLPAINIKMNFLSVLSKASWHQLFSQFFFPASIEYLFINLSFQPILFQFLSSHKKLFFPPSIFDFLSSQRCMNIILHSTVVASPSIRTKKWVWRMCPDPAGLQTTEASVMRPSLLEAPQWTVCTNGSASFLVTTRPA